MEVFILIPDNQPDDNMKKQARQTWPVLAEQEDSCIPPMVISALYQICGGQSRLAISSGSLFTRSSVLTVFSKCTSFCFHEAAFFKNAIFLKIFANKKNLSCKISFFEQRGATSCQRLCENVSLQQLLRVYQSRVIICRTRAVDSFNFKI